MLLLAHPLCERTRSLYGVSPPGPGSPSSRSVPAGTAKSLAGCPGISRQGGKAMRGTACCPLPLAGLPCLRLPRQEQKREVSAGPSRRDRPRAGVGGARNFISALGEEPITQQLYSACFRGRLIT